MKALYSLFVFFMTAGPLVSQVIETRFGIQTTFNGKTPVAYEENFGSLVLNSNSGDLTFTTDLARLRTNNKRTDSLLMVLENIPFSFRANLAQGLFAIVNEENDETFHRVVGTILVNNVAYNAEALVRVNNPGVKSDMSKALLDLQLEVDPAKINIPVLSDYFKKVLLFQVNDGMINQNY